MICFARCRYCFIFASGYAISALRCYASYARCCHYAVSYAIFDAYLIADIRVAPRLRHADITPLCCHISLRRRHSAVDARVDTRDKMLAATYDATRRRDVTMALLL